MFLLKCLLGGAIVGTVHASCGGSNHAENNLRSKLSMENGPSAGADYWVGSKMAAIYLFVEHENTEEEPGNHFGVKVAIHEYHHLLQQGFYSRQITTATPAANPISNKFNVKNYGNIDSIFETKVQAAMNALPASLTLLNVPTLLLLIPQREGGIGADVLESAITEVMELQFEVSKSCPGVNFYTSATANENNAIAEGEAEYYALNTYAPSVVAGWTTPFESVREWQEKTAANTAFLAGPPCQDVPADRCPDAGTFHIKDGSGDTMGKLEDDFKWGGNAAGELAWNYLITAWRPEITQLDIFNVHIKSACKGFGAAFEEVMGAKWSSFVCDMELAYGVISSSSECSGYAPAYDLGWQNPCTREYSSGTNPACESGAASAITDCPGVGSGDGGNNGGSCSYVVKRGSRVLTALAGAAAAAFLGCQ